MSRRSQKNIVAFNSGEWSPLLDARPDLEKYNSGCRQLQNAILEAYGCAVGRPGLQYIAGAKFNDKKSRLIDFQFSATTTFVLELGHLYMRFYSNGAQVMDGLNPVEITTPWGETEIFALHFAQINDVVYFTHSDHPTQKLIRVADDDWELSAVDYDIPPLLDENLTDTTLAAGATTGTSIALVASEDLFLAGHVGAYWEVAHMRDANEKERMIADAADWLTATEYAVWDIRTYGGSRYRCLVAHTSGVFADDLAANRWVATTDYQITVPMRVLGEWTMRTYGTWTAGLRIERSLDGGTTWEIIRRFSGKNDRNIDQPGKQETEALMRVVVEGWVDPGTPVPDIPGRVVLEVANAYVYGLVKIKTVTNAKNAICDVIHDLLSTAATKVWSEGAWSAVRGYPRTCVLFEQRMCYGGTAHQPQTIWGSVVGDFENFRRGVDDTDSFAYTLGATKRSPIMWLVAQSGLLMGTSVGEWVLRSGLQNEAETPVTPTNVYCHQQSTYGSSGIQGLLVNEVCLFVQRGGMRVREMTYSIERDGWVAPDLTMLAEHIAKGEIVQMAYQQEPRSILWCVTGGGKLIGLTYQRDQTVVGWHRHETDGHVESVTTIYGQGDDEIWVVVKRLIDGGYRRYIERINPVQWETLEDAFYVDCGKTYTPAKSVLIQEIRPDLFMTAQVAIEDPSGMSYYEENYFFLVEAEAHGFVDGEYIRITGTHYDGEYAVAVADDDTFYLLKASSAGQAGPYWEDPLPPEASDPRQGNLHTVYRTRPTTQAFVGLPDSVGGRAETITTVLTGLAHLEGKVVTVLADGAVAPAVAVVGGQIELADPVAKAQVGLPYEVVVEPMRLDVDGNTGITMGQVKQVREIVLRLHKSVGVTYGDGKTDYNLSFRATTDPMDAAPPIFTGDKKIPFDGDFDTDTRIIIKQKQPLPFTLLALVIKYFITGS